jgi:DNA polymerase-3 subunit delta
MLLKYLDSPNPDKVLVIITAKLTAAQKKAKWFKAIEQAGEIITLWPIKPRELPRWISQRMQSAGLKASHECITMLAELTEGNLLATSQAIEKLRLLYPTETIAPKQLAAAIADTARFNVFDLVNYILAGDAPRVTRIIMGLRDEGTEAVFVLWALARELRLLIDYAFQIQQGQPMAQVIQREWANRKPLLQHTLKRHPLATWQKLLMQAGQIDAIIKGMKTGNAWNGLLDLSLAIAGTKIVSLETTP